MHLFTLLFIHLIYLFVYLILHSLFHIQFLYPSIYHLHMYIFICSSFTAFTSTSLFILIHARSSHPPILSRTTHPPKRKPKGRCLRYQPPTPSVISLKGGVLKPRTHTPYCASLQTATSWISELKKTTGGTRRWLVHDQSP